MTELSFAWDCLPAVGDFSPYTLEIVEATQRIMGNINPLSAGVVYWTDPTVFPSMTNATTQLLLPLFLAGNTIRIHKGVGMVQGWIYLNDVDIDTDVSGGNANATDIIGLRRDLIGQTVRLFHGRGAAGLTYTLVQTNTIWEIPLTEVTLDGSGNFSSIVDVRSFVLTPLNPPQEFQSYCSPIVGWDGTNVQSVPMTAGSGSGQAGVLLAPNVDTNAFAYGTIPLGLVGDEIDMEFFFLNSGLTSSAGNVYLQARWATRSGAGFASGNTGFLVKTVGAQAVQNFSVTLADFSEPIPSPFFEGAILQLTLHRLGDQAQDTYAFDLVYLGAVLKANLNHKQVNLAYPIT